MEPINGLTRFQNAEQSPVNVATQGSAVSNKVMPSQRFANAVNSPQNAVNKSSILAGLPTSTQSYLNNQVNGISGNFVVPKTDAFPSNYLSNNLTATDLFQKRSQMESEQIATQASSASLNKALGNAESLATQGSTIDPDTFVRSLVFDAQPTDLENQQKGSVGKIEGMLSGLLGKGKRTLGIEAEAGVPQMQQELMKLNTQIAQTKNAYDQTAVGIQNEAGQTVMGAESRLTPLARQQAVDLGALSSLAQAYQGNIELAMDIAERTVNLEYGDIEQAIQNEMTMIEARKPLLEGEEKKRAEKVELALTLRKEKIETEKANKATVMELAVEAAKNGAPSTLVQSATKMSDPMSAISILSGYMSDPLERSNKLLTNRKLLAEVSQAEEEARQIVETGKATGEYASVINTAANLLGAEKAKTSRKDIANAIASKDYETAFATIANNVESALTGTSKTLYADSRTDLQVLSGLRDAVEQYSANGGDMGLVKGTEEQIKRKLGIDSGEASELAVQLWREFQFYRSNMTGAAFSPAESRDYASVNPTLGKSLDLNLSVIDGAVSQLGNRVISTIETRVPGSRKIYDLANGVQESTGTSGTTNVSDDDGYNVYLQVTGQQPEPTQETPTQKPVSTPSMLQGISSGYSGINFNSFLK